MPVVLLHPVGLDGHCWDGVALERSIAYDLPGHGGRPRPRQFTIAALADDVVRNVEGPLDLVGLSMGGMVALVIALQYRERVRSLMVGCSSAFTIPEVMLERAEAAEREGMEGVLRGTLERWFIPAALADADHAGVRYARARLLADRPADFAAAWRPMTRHDVPGRLGEIGVPVTAIAGEQDMSELVAALQAIAEGVAHVRLVVLRARTCCRWRNRTRSQLPSRATFRMCRPEPPGWAGARGDNLPCSGRSARPRGRPRTV